VGHNLTSSRRTDQLLPTQLFHKKNAVLNPGSLETNVICTTTENDYCIPGKEMRISGFLAVQQVIQNEHCPVSFRKESFYVIQTHFT